MRMCVCQFVGVAAHSPSYPHALRCCSPPPLQSSESFLLLDPSIRAANTSVHGKVLLQDPDCDGCMFVLFCALAVRLLGAEW